MSEKPENTGVIRDDKGRFPPGVSGNPDGKPKGSISFMSRIKKILAEEPDKFEELCRYYINDKRMRDLLLKMVDGMPKQNIGFGDDDVVTEVDIKIRKNENKS